MAGADYNEDKKFILESLQELKSNVGTLFQNDNDIKVAIATMNTKMMMVNTFVAFSFALAGILINIYGVHNESQSAQTHSQTVQTGKR